MLAVLAGVVALIFLIVDGYHGWLYAQAAEHLRAAEWVLSRYFAALARGNDDRAMIDKFDAELRAHRFGLFLSLKRKLRPTFLWYASPGVIYRVLYPLLVVLAAAAAVAIGPLGAGKTERQSKGSVPQNVSSSQNVTSLVLATMTVSERRELRQLSIKLEHAQNPHDRQLGSLIGKLLAGAPGTIAAIASWSHTASSFGEKALGIVSGLLERALSGALGTFGPTLNLSHSQVSVGGVSFTFNSPPSQTACCYPCGCGPPKHKKHKQPKNKHPTKTPPRNNPPKTKPPTHEPPKNIPPRQPLAPTR
jgi:hypothetical protein